MYASSVRIVRVGVESKGGVGWKILFTYSFTHRERVTERNIIANESKWYAGTYISCTGICMLQRKRKFIFAHAQTQYTKEESKTILHFIMLRSPEFFWASPLQKYKSPTGSDQGQLFQQEPARCFWVAYKKATAYYQCFVLFWNTKSSEINILLKWRLHLAIIAYSRQSHGPLPRTRNSLSQKMVGGNHIFQF